MADEKKPDAKSAESSWFSHSDPFVEIVWLMLSGLILLYLVNGFVGLLNSGSFSILGFDFLNTQTTLSSQISTWFRDFFPFFQWIAVLVSLLLVAFIVNLYKKLVVLRREEAKQFYIEKTETTTVNNPQWERVLKHIESTNDSDWRLAILEADIVLDTLLDNMGLHGETMGDKLKAVEKSDFTTIDNAWEAHKVRNQIAHEGGAFILSQHETRRVVALYQSVFEEFHII